MGLNKSSGNMYSWINATWNTVKGECPHGCTYCYMKRFGKQKPVRFDELELKTDLGSGNFIFVGSSCDLFADAIPDLWLYKTLATCIQFDNSYLFQSKNPVNILGSSAILPKKSVVCTTIETNRWYPEIMKKSPDPAHRAMWMGCIDLPKYVTIEPIMDFDVDEMIDLIRRCNPVQVNIGADSGNNNLPEPSKEKLYELIDALKEFTVIDQKRNLSRLLNS
jgi:DNA repair photolyase